MKKIISHNTFSCLPVRQWWLKPFAWMARCQDKRMGIQLFTYKVRGIDIRIRFDKDGKPHFAHGLAEYGYDAMRSLNHALTTRRITMARVMLETTPFMTRYQRARQKELFWVFCDTLKDKYPDITFYGGWPRDEWRQKVYDFETKEPSVTEMHGSVSGCKLNCLRLKAWARKHNSEIIENAKTEYVMLDYVEFR